MHQLIHYNMGSKSAIGIGNGICFKQVRDKGGGSYIDPLVRDSLVGVWIADQNTNESPTRNIIKNTIKDKGGDLELLNFGYKLNSGYGKYEEDFTDWLIYPNIKVTDSVITTDGNFKSSWFIYKHSSESKINEMNIKVSGIPKGGKILYFYISDETANLPIAYTIPKDGIYHLPESKINNNRASVGFTVESRYDWNNIRIEQIPSFEGAVVTDGVDDLITSTKTVKKMLGGSNEITVVSMMANLDSRQILCNSNYNNTNGYNVRNILEPNGVISMLGYTDKNGTTNNLNLIMGDKNSIKLVDKVNFNSDYVFYPAQYYKVYYQVAWYWTIIAKIALTTDQINQVISYFNLDKHVKPDIIYDTIRQGITNENHASFNDELVDFSGNGHNMKIYNSAWKLGSGIGKYEADYSTWTKTAGVISTSFGFKITEPTHNYWLLYTSNITVPAHKVEISGIPEGGEFRYLGVHILKNGINELPKMEEHPSAIGFTLHRGTTQPSDWVGLSVEQIPDYEGALVSDGKDDYGKAEGLPILKDYTVAADYARLAKNISSIGDSPILSKSIAAGNGAFIMNNIDNSGTTTCYSFGTVNIITLEDIQRKIYYQSKYSNQGKGINAGSIEDGTSMWLDTIRDNDTRFIESAFYSMLLFPYSLSEFLLERQLKRYKLGTLYPGMIEWRPKVNINVPVVTPPTFSINNGSDIITNGQYIPEGTEITIRIFTTTDSSVVGLNEATAKINGVDIELSPSGNKTYYGGKFIVSSKQKIDITIDEYIRYEDIVQPYPAIINLKQDGKTITWGDKLKVGSEVTFVNHTNLLPDLYTVSGGVQYNGTFISWNTSIRVEKSMVFVNPHSYKKANEPSCILSPNRLRIPNSSYKILGYIPDLTGKGNHGRLNNFAYTEESGANEDGSIRFDGTDDHIIIPTIKHGGKALLMKVNWRYKNNIAMAYDQRINWGGLGISISRDQLPLVAYKPYNKVTYIDGIKNESVLVQDLEGITHNITGIYDNLDLSDERNVCISRTSDASNSGFADMSMYEFMLFPDVPNEEEIKELNDIVGIEGNVWGTLTQLINSTLISNETLIKNE